MTDVWFDGDVPRVAGTLADRWDDRHRRSTVHPLLPSLTAATYAVRAVARVDAAASVTAVVVAMASLWGGVLFALLRVVGCGRGDAALLAALGLSSAGAVFWLTVPESFAAGSVTIMVGLLPAALAARGRRPRDRWFAVASAASLAVTTTNWMAGLLGAASALPWRRALRASAAALAAVTLLWCVQKAFVPHAGFFLQRLGDEQRFVASPTPSRVWEVGRAFVARSVVAPTPELVGREYPVPVPADAPPARGPVPMRSGRALSVQGAAGQGSAWGWLASASWLTLLGLGAASLRRGGGPLGRFGGVVALFLAGQLALHLVYGKETFLYSLDYLPGLLLVAAAGVLGPRRRAARVCAALTLLGASMNNVRQFRRAAAFVALEAAAVRATPAAASSTSAPPHGAAPRHA